MDFEDLTKKVIESITEIEIKGKAELLRKEKRITYFEHCGENFFFNKEYQREKRPVVYLQNGDKHIRLRRKNEYNVCIQYTSNDPNIREKMYLLCLSTRKN